MSAEFDASGPRCLGKDCLRLQVKRGLCKRCYMRAYRLVVQYRKATWEQLMDRGEILPAKDPALRAP